jgi:hypothetical protein
MHQFKCNQHASRRQFARVGVGAEKAPATPLKVQSGAVSSGAGTGSVGAQSDEACKQETCRRWCTSPQDDDRTVSTEVMLAFAVLTF